MFISLEIQASEVTIFFPGISRYLYENCLNDVFIMIFSQSMEYISSSSCFPEKVFLFPFFYLLLEPKKKCEKNKNKINNDHRN